MLPHAPVRSGYLLVEACNLDHDTFVETLPMLHCTPPILTLSYQFMPRLIDVAALSLAQQQQLDQVLLCELSGEHAPIVCAWLICERDADAVARHIRRFLVGPGAGGASVLWRYYDPRVFSLAVQLFSQEQTCALLGPVTEWRFPWRQRWWRVAGAGQETDPLQGATPAWPSSGQWASLGQSELVERTLSKIQHPQDRQAAMTDAICLRLQREINAAMLDARQRLHLSEPDDLVEYALHCALYGNAFRRHPMLAWDDLAHGRVSWSDMIAAPDMREMTLMGGAA